jgi:hypothetical protein
MRQNRRFRRRLDALIIECGIEIGASDLRSLRKSSMREIERFTLKRH